MPHISRGSDLGLGRGTFKGDIGLLGYAGVCPAVDILEMTRKGTAPRDAACWPSPLPTLPW